MTACQSSLSNEARQEAYAAIGKALVEEAQSFGARPMPRESLINAGKLWFERNQDALRDALRSNPEIRSVAYGAKQRDYQRLAGLITDCLIVPFAGLPIASIATLVAHIYLDHFLGTTAEGAGDSD